MNGLEALKRIRQETAPNTYCKDFDKEECCNTIEKELKALEIIKRKGIDLDEFNRHDKACTYNAHTTKCYCIGLTNEEFDLLKEVLK